MVVLEHEHSLSLIDLNPKYPHDEEVYDDEEDLIIKQAFQYPCDRCNQEITYLHRYYYKCDHCDYSLHKLCEQLPTKLEHPSHSAHTLTLFLDKSQGQCYMCKRIRYKQLCYHCSKCMINICLDCCMDDVQYHTIYHPNHQHPLIPFCKQRQILAECDGCGKEHKGVFYECPTCFRTSIHEDCVFQPKRLLIQDGTRGRFFHTHQLILTYSFPKAYQKAKFYPTCRVCDNSFSDNENLWLYKCEKCRYYVHLGCASLRCEPSNLGFRLRSNVFENDHVVLHLPLINQTFNRLKHFFLKETNETSITHASHEHPLVRCNDTTTPMSKVEEICNGCVRPIMAMPFYRCTHGCDFVLHEWCTRLPTALKHYIGHPQHTLNLMPKARYNVVGTFMCNVCSRLCNGFAYSCVRCSYDIDVTCAFIPTKLIHKSHPHNVLIRTGQRHDKDYCRMCLSSFEKDATETSFSCDMCNFHVHPRCALVLPETIRHKYDKHPMTLSYSPIENHEGDYFCEVCEEELNPNGCFYHCHQCVQSMHTSCALLVYSQIKPYIDGFSLKDDYENENIKVGSIHKTEDHPHPLSFLRWTESDGRFCSKCSDSLLYYQKLIFKCLQCKFAIHPICAVGFKLAQT